MGWYKDINAILEQEPTCGCALSGRENGLPAARIRQPLVPGAEGRLCIPGRAVCAGHLPGMQE